MAALPQQRIDQASSARRGPQPESGARKQRSRADARSCSSRRRAPVASPRSAASASARRRPPRSRGGTARGVTSRPRRASASTVLAVSSVQLVPSRHHALDRLARRAGGVPARELLRVARAQARAASSSLAAGDHLRQAHADASHGLRRGGHGAALHEGVPPRAHPRGRRARHRARGAPVAIAVGRLWSAPGGLALPAHGEPLHGELRGAAPLLPRAERQLHRAPPRSSRSCVPTTRVTTTRASCRSGTST